MKTFVIENNSISYTDRDSVWYFLPDSALCNSGKPFFIPEFADKVEVCLSAVMKITRLGKTIQPRFAHRYYSEMAPALHFRIPALREKLMSEGFAPDMGQAFDRSLIIGEFLPAEEFLTKDTLALKINGRHASTWDGSAFKKSPDEILAEVSASNTMKMGDLILHALAEGVGIDIGDLLEVCRGERLLLTVPVK